jgi:hypothetical protein
VTEARNEEFEKGTHLRHAMLIVVLLRSGNDELAGGPPECQPGLDIAPEVNACPEA